MNTTADIAEDRAAKELRREYKRQYNQRKKTENAEYNRRYWDNQLEHLERELLAIDETDLAKRIRTSTGTDLTAAIKDALARVKTLPSAFTGKV